MPVNPFADRPLRHAAFVGSGANLLRVILDQRFIHISGVVKMRFLNLGRLLRQVLPQPVAHHLKLHRFDMRPL